MAAPLYHIPGAGQPSRATSALAGAAGNAGDSGDAGSMRTVSQVLAHSQVTSATVLLQASR